MKRIIRQECKEGFILTHYDDGTQEEVPYAEPSEEYLKEGFTGWFYHDPDKEMQRIEELKRANTMPRM